MKKTRERVSAGGIAMAESIFVGILMAMVVAAEVFGLWIDASK